MTQLYKQFNLGVIIIGLAFGFGVLLAPVLTLAEAISAAELGVIAGDTADTDTGYAVAGAGDVNGDGYDDIVLGAPSAGEDGEGAIYIVYGKSVRFDEADVSTAVQFTGEVDGDQFGSRVAGVGDVNGDGYDDVVAAALYSDTSNHNAGAVYIIYGGANLSGGSIKDLPTYTGSEDNAKLGFGLAAGGDINADGYADVLIGAPYRSDRSGGVYIIYGQGANLAGGSASQLPLLSGHSDYDYAGYAVASGDINADGFSDIVASAPKRNTTERDTGVIYIVYGQAAQHVSQSFSTVAVISGLTRSERIGQSLAVGDMNADSYGDIIIGAQYNDTAAENGGAVYIYYGSASLSTDLSLSAATQLYNTANAEVAGQSLAWLGDVTSDGYGDFIVGAPSTSHNETGRVFLVTGQSAMLTAQPLDSFSYFTGETIADSFGNSVAAAGDVNADGYGDAVFGAKGYGQVAEGAGAAYVVYWPILTCDNSSALGHILANYPDTDWKDRNYSANSKLHIVIERKGQNAYLVNCKTDEVVQTLTFNTRTQRKILARVFRARGLPVFIVVTRTPSKRKIKLFFYEQTVSELVELDRATRKWRPRGLRIKLRKRNHFVLQRGKETKHRLLYRITTDMKLEEL